MSATVTLRDSVQMMMTLETGSKLAIPSLKRKSPDSIFREIMSSTRSELIKDQTTMKDLYV